MAMATPHNGYYAEHQLLFRTGVYHSGLGVTVSFK